MAKMSIVPKLIDELLKKEFNSLQLVSELSDRSRNKKKTVPSGIESFLSLEPKIWDLVPQEIKNSQTLSAFNCKIKSRILQTYHC